MQFGKCHCRPVKTKKTGLILLTVCTPAVCHRCSWSRAAWSRGNLAVRLVTLVMIGQVKQQLPPLCSRWKSITRTLEATDSIYIEQTGIVDDKEMSNRPRYLWEFTDRRTVLRVTSGLWGVDRFIQLR